MENSMYWTCNKKVIQWIICCQTQKLIDNFSLTISSYFSVLGLNCYSKKISDISQDWKSQGTQNMWVALLCNSQYCYGSSLPENEQILQQLCGKCLFLVVWELLEWNPTQIYVIPLYSMLMLWNSKKRVFILHDQKDFFPMSKFYFIIYCFSQWRRIHAKFISKTEVFWESQNI